VKALAKWSKGPGRPLPPRAGPRSPQLGPPIPSE